MRIKQLENHLKIWMTIDRSIQCNSNKWSSMRLPLPPHQKSTSLCLCTWLFFVDWLVLLKAHKYAWSLLLLQLLLLLRVLLPMLLFISYKQGNREIGNYTHIIYVKCVPLVCHRIFFGWNNFNNCNEVKSFWNYSALIHFNMYTV